MPCIENLLYVSSDHGLCVLYLLRVKANRSGNLNLWQDPKLGLTVRVTHMNVKSGFLSREEKEAKGPVSEDRGRQESVLRAR
jgi:hypothetical protein